MRIERQSQTNQPAALSNSGASVQVGRGEARNRGRSSNGCRMIRAETATAVMWRRKPGWRIRVAQDLVTWEAGRSARGAWSRVPRDGVRQRPIRSTGLKAGAEDTHRVALPCVCFALLFAAALRVDGMAGGGWWRMLGTQRWMPMLKLTTILLPATEMDAERPRPRGREDGEAERTEREKGRPNKRKYSKNQPTKEQNSPFRENEGGGSLCWGEGGRRFVPRESCKLLLSKRAK